MASSAFTSSIAYKVANDVANVNADDDNADKDADGIIVVVLVVIERFKGFTYLSQDGIRPSEVCKSKTVENW